MFQKIIIDKYIELNLDKIQSAYKRYVTFFHDIKQSEYLHQCKETELKSCLLHELFINVLDYKLALEHNYNFISKEKNQTDNNDSGTVVIIDNNVRIVIELKSIKTTEIKQSELCRKHFKFQQHKNIKAGLPINKHLYITENSSVNSSKIFSYGYKNLNTTYVIITNLEKLLLYVDNVVEHVEWNLFSLNEEQFALLWLCLAYENIVNDLPKKLKTETIIHQDKIIKEFYNVYKEFQNVLFIDLISQNAGLDRLMLFLCTQKILNRLLFILFADDCGLLPSGTIKEIIREWRNLDDADEYRPMYMYLQKYFSYLDNGGKGKKQNIFGYNGGLFKPIEFLDKLKISDSILVDYLIKLSSYNYRNDINVEVLGHIFENFISEIERLKYKLSGVKNYDLQVVDKRQKDVIFYPMGFVASYIIESTVGQLCMEKKSELGLCKYELLEQIDLEVKSNVKKPKKVATTAILDKLEEYRQWLLSLSVCDPACGSGTFLIAVLDFLKNEHHYIDRITAQILGHSIVFSEYELSILENNIFGVDINEECVEITKLALWLRTAKPNHKLNSLDANIKCGNSLISDPKIDSNKTFEWHKEFPNIFKNGGFNVVIGNPPYIFARMGKFSEAEKEYYYARYPLANYQLNTYLLFIDLSYRHLLRENGVLGFIVPNNCLTINMFQPFRKFLLEKVGNVRIVNISSNVFNDTNADNCIITFTKKNADTISLGEINNEKVTIFGSFSAKNFACGKYVINIRMAKKPETIKLIRKIEITTKNIEQNATITTGIKAYQTGKGKLLQTTQTKESRIYHSREQKNNEFIKYLDSKDVGRYSLTWSGEYIKYGDWLAEPRRNVDFSAPRILVRQIPNQPPNCINAVFTKDHAINDLNSMIIFEFKFEPLYLLSILNSRLMSFWFVNKFDKFQKEIFPQFKVNELALLPIKTCSTQKQKTLSTLADKMLSLHNELHNKRKVFLQQLTDNFNDARLTENLENFDKIEFKDFLTALLRRNIKLQLDKQTQWEKIFNNCRSKCRNITNQIAETDNEIDLLVYELYKLTEDEIEVINTWGNTQN